MKLNPLVSRLREVLSIPGSGGKIGDHQCSTAIDEFFSKLEVSYKSFDNQFLRAELAEKILLDILVRTQGFRESEIGGQADVDWFDGEKWNPVSIKYKGPNKEKGKFRAPRPSDQLSGLSWSKNASGAAPTKLTCDMLVIWDAWSNPYPKIKSVQLNYPKGIFVICPDEFNPGLEFVESGKQNKTNSAFKISVISPYMTNQEQWIRNQGNRSVRIASLDGFRIKFSVG